MFESNLAPLVDFATRWWSDHGANLIFASLIAAVGFIVVSMMVAKKNGHLPRWMARFGNAIVLVLSAEGMWEFFTGLLKLPTLIAAGGFAFGEFLLLSSMMHARAHYEATTKREGKTVVRWGHTGRHGRTVWIVATVIGLIVATASDHWQEIPFRLALPLGAALIWYTELTASSETKRSRWRWTPSRLLIELGLLEPAETDLDESEVVKRQRIRRMTKVACKIDVLARKKDKGEKLSDSETRRFNRLELRLQKLARDADDAQIADVGTNLVRVREVRRDIDPDNKHQHARELAALEADHNAQLEQLRQAAAAEVADLTRQLREAQGSRSSEVEQLREALASEQQRGQALGQERDRLKGSLAAEQQRTSQMSARWRDNESHTRDLEKQVRELSTTAAAPTSGAGWRQVPAGSAPAPRAGVDGTAALQPAPVAVTATASTVKDAVCEAWTNAALRGDVSTSMSSSQLYDYAVKYRVVDDTVPRDTVLVYARQWLRAAVVTPQHRRAGIRLVDEHQ